jgi:hypothetical protein
VKAAERPERRPNWAKRSADPIGEAEPPDLIGHLDPSDMKTNRFFGRTTDKTQPSPSSKLREGKSSPMFSPWNLGTLDFPRGLSSHGQIRFCIVLRYSSTQILINPGILGFWNSLLSILYRFCTGILYRGLAITGSAITGPAGGNPPADFSS